MSEPHTFGQYAAISAFFDNARRLVVVRRLDDGKYPRAIVVHPGPGKGITLDDHWSLAVWCDTVEEALARYDKINADPLASGPYLSKNRR